MYKYKAVQTKIMSIFHRRQVTFSKHDPLDDGLKDDINAEQKEADAFQTLDDMSGEELANQWNTIVKDIEKDPDWFSFSND